MAEGSVTCPHCRKPFELTTAMAAGIEARLRAEIELEAGKRLKAIELREKEAGDKLAELTRGKAELEGEVARRLTRERNKLAEQLKKQAQEDAALEVNLLKERLDANARKLEESRRREEELLRKEVELQERSEAIESEVAAKLAADRRALIEKARKEAVAALGGRVEELERRIREDAEKLDVARKAELELRKQKAALEDERRSFELEKQRAIDAERTQILEKVRGEVDEEYRLKVLEKEKVIEDMKRKLDEAKRKSEQGSQQLQGEVLELDLEDMLRSAFPMDEIEPVGKGVAGGDLLQRIIGPGGVVAGAILWESKRTKNWSDGWVEKLKADQREAKADVAALVSSALPKGVENFGALDGLWVSNRPCALPLATALRSSILSLAHVRKANEGRQSKMELVYEYLTGPTFRHRVEAIKEAFESMREDLDTEKKLLQKQWAKREKEIEKVIGSTVGLYGDLQGIAGKTLPEIEGLEPRAYLGAAEEPGL